MYSSISVALFASAIICPLIAAVAIGLRFYARKVKEVKPNASDYLVVLALVENYTQSWKRVVCPDC